MKCNKNHFYDKKKLYVALGEGIRSSSYALFSFADDTHAEGSLLYK